MAFRIPWSRVGADVRYHRGSGWFNLEIVGITGMPRPETDDDPSEWKESGIRGGLKSIHAGAAFRHMATAVKSKLPDKEPAAA